jgi:hypothetical protein
VLIDVNRITTERRRNKKKVAVYQRFYTLWPAYNNNYARWLGHFELTGKDFTYASPQPGGQMMFMLIFQSKRRREHIYENMATATPRTRYAWRGQVNSRNIPGVLKLAKKKHDTY